MRVQIPAMNTGKVTVWTFYNFQKVCRYKMVSSLVWKMLVQNVHGVIDDCFVEV